MQRYFDDFKWHLNRHNRLVSFNAYARKFIAAAIFAASLIAV
jgi:hypothetical protein